MSDPKDKGRDSDSPTLVPDGRSAPHAGTGVQSNPGTSRPASSPSDAPTMIGMGLPAPSSASDAPTRLDVPLSQGLPPPTQAVPMSGIWQAPSLVPGTILGSRYEILKTVGEGGMGAVYQARDRELGRLVALKVIRPELASNPDILQRFKQEILLASRVTDRNIIRIYDLGDADGVKFITMEYVEGEDLRSVLRRQGKLVPGEAVDIMEQVANGLVAAHREGIIHRDLKPGNIMRDSQGRVLVMDFGLARSLGGDGLTRTGMMLGTMEYMSPEQAQGKELDARSDIFTVGLILYELLTGIMPFQAESAIASLLKRTQQRAIPVSDIDKNIPGVLSNIVSKCLERDPAMRYNNAGELLSDLRAWQGKSGGSRVSVSTVGLWANRLRELSWSRIAMIAVLLVAAMSGVAWYASRTTHPAAVVAHTPVSVLVADFQNNTSDSLFDDTLEPMFNVALEGASFINAYKRGAARKVAEKLPNPTEKLDGETARLVAVKEGISAIVTGSLDSHGSGYSLSVKAIDAVTGKTLASAQSDTANKDALLMEVPKLAVPIRKALGDTTPESAQIAAAQGSFTASNLGAAHYFSLGMEQQSAGKLQESLGSFSKALELDPNFARAYAGMAGVYGNLDQPQDAEKYAKLALEHVDRLSERERYRLRGQYYIRTQNWQKCIEEYSELVKQYPADNAGENNLATCYAFALNLPKAMEEGGKAVKISPKDVQTGINYTQYACYASDFPSCERAARAVYELNPQFEEAFIALAYAQMGQNQLTQAAETYHRLEKVSDWGASLSASGLANLALYQGNVREAVQILEKGAAADLAGKKPDLAADKFLIVQYANLLGGNKPGALAAAQKALAASQTTKIRFLTARTFVEAGETAKAKKLAESLASEIQIASQAYSKIVLGEIALKEHNPKEAIQLFSEARDKVDTWIGRYDLGRAFLDAGAFTEADSEFERCIKRRGEALELFMDDMPTYSYLPSVYYFQGRDREGLKSPDFADSYKAYLSIRGQSTEDPLVAEIRHRLGQ